MYFWLLALSVALVRGQTCDHDSYVYTPDCPAKCAGGTCERVFGAINACKCPRVNFGSGEGVAIDVKSSNAEIEETRFCGGARFHVSLDACEQNKNCREGTCKKTNLELYLCECSATPHDLKPGCNPVLMERTVSSSNRLFRAR